MSYRTTMSSPSQAAPRGLDLPPSGPGSAGSIGRRLAALCIDWFACLALALLINGGFGGPGEAPSLLTLGIFFAEVTILTWLQGASFGQRVVGLVVAPVGRLRIGLVGAAVRTLLLCLVIPAVVMQPNGRGLHDLAVGSIVLRR